MDSATSVRHPWRDFQRVFGHRDLNLRSVSGCTLNSYYTTKSFKWPKFFPFLCLSNIPISSFLTGITEYNLMAETKQVSGSQERKFAPQCSFLLGMLNHSCTVWPSCSFSLKLAVVCWNSYSPWSIVEQDWASLSREAVSTTDQGLWAESHYRTDTVLWVIANTAL